MSTLDEFMKQYGHGSAAQGAPARQDSAQAAAGKAPTSLESFMRQYGSPAPKPVTAAPAAAAQITPPAAPAVSYAEQMARQFAETKKREGEAAKAKEDRPVRITPPAAPLMPLSDSWRLWNLDEPERAEKDGPTKEEKPEPPAEEDREQAEEDKRRAELEERHKALTAELDEIEANAGYITDPDAANAAQKRKSEIITELHGIDAELGSPARFYDEASRLGATLTGAAQEQGAGYLTAGGLALSLAGEQDETGRAIADSAYAGYATDPLSEANMRAAVEQGAAPGSIRVLEENERLAEGLYGAADKLAEESAVNLGRAKEGLTGFDALAVDLAKGAADLTGDALASLIVPGSGMAAMATRIFGNAAAEVRREGGSTDKQLLAGLKAAGIEVLTEKLAGPFEKIYGKSFAGKAISRALDGLDNPVIARALSMAGDALGEGAEEILSDVLNPIADRLLKLDDGTGSVFKDTTLSQVLYDGLVGAILGMFGSAVKTTDGGAVTGETIAEAEQQAVSAATQAMDRAAQPASEALQETDRQEQMTEPAQRTDVAQILADLVTGQRGKLNIDNAAADEYSESNRTNAPEVENNGPGRSAEENRGGVSGVPSGREADLEGQRGSDGTHRGSGLSLLSEESRDKLTESGVLAEMEDFSADTAAFSAARDDMNPSASNSRSDVMDEREGISAPGARPEKFNTRSDEFNTARFTPQDDNAVVGQTARTISEAKATPERRLQSIQDAVAGGRFSYVPTSDQSLADEAVARVERNGWQQSLVSWSKDVTAGKANEDLAAMGAVLLNNAGNSDMSAEQYIELATDYNALMHRLGRGLAAARILSSLSPEGKLYGIQRSVEKLNSEAKGKYGVELPPELVEEYRRQTTDEGRTEVISKMQQAIADQIPSSLGDKLTALRYTAMLGNFKTQVRNVQGNAAMLAARIVKDRLAASMELIGHAVSGGKMERTKSLWAGRQLYSEAWADFDSVADEALGEAKYSDSRRQFEKDVQDKRTIFKNNGTWGTDQAKNTLGRSAPVIAARKVADVGMLGLEGWRKATNWAMEMGDVIFSRTNYADALAGWLKAHKIESIADASPELMERARTYAIKQAQEATFRDTNDFSSWVSSLGRGNSDNKVAKVAGAVGEGIQPFRKTPANVLVRAEEYSPLGVLNTAVKTVEALKGKPNMQASDVFDSLSKALTGTGISMLGYFMAAAGLARGKSDDEEQENFDKLRGKQDYSIVFPGIGSFTMDWISPHSIPFFMGVAFYDATSDGGLTPQEAWKVLGSITDPMLEMSMLSGVNDALDSITSYGEDTDALPMFLMNSLASLLSQFAPTLLGQFEQASEKYRQTTYTDSDSFLPRSIQRQLGKTSAKIPGVDYHQQDYIDAWGRKQETKLGAAKLFETFLSPGYFGTDRSTPVDDELQRLYDAGQSKVFPEYAARSTKVNNVTLTPEEYERYATVKGQTSLELVQDFVQSEEYKGLDDTARADIIGNLYALANDKAKREVASMRGESYSNSTWDKVIAAEEAGTSAVDLLLEKKGYSSTEYRAYAEEKQAVGVEKFDAVEALVSAAFKNRKSEYDSKGTYAAAGEVLKSGLTDQQIDALISGNFARGKGGFAAGYSALRSAGNTPQQAVDLFKSIDTDGNGALKQEELWAAYEKDSKAESGIQALWDAYSYAKTWAQYKEGKRK